MSADGPPGTADGMLAKVTILRSSGARGAQVIWYQRFWVRLYTVNLPFLEALM
jgi:hypothetical protein